MPRSHRGHRAYPVRFLRVLGVSAAMSVFFSSNIFSQVAYNHPEIEWKSFETEHFVIDFYRGTERTAREGAFVAETIYPHVTGLYSYEPATKTHIVFLDTDDFSNGATYYYDNKIEIWASPLDFELRGSHRWLQNVITHEFTHIVSLQKAMKFGQKIPGAYLQWIGYEEEKRKDVLYGYPHTLVSYPIPGTIVPPWLAEGTAQYMYEGATYDFWDTHRDMILRDRALHDNLLTFVEMSTFGKSGIGNESTYNSGFALVKYIANSYGSDALVRIVEELSSPFRFSVSSAIEKAIGITGDQLYEDFRHQLKEHYSRATQGILDNEHKGKILIDEGTTNIHPVWAPDGKRFAYLSNAGNDFFAQTDLYIYTFKDGKSERIAEGVISAPSWASSRNVIYYSKKSKPNRHGSRWYDLYEYSFAEEKEHRLTRGTRAFSPILLPGDSVLAYLAVKDGTHNVFLVNLNSRESQQLTNFDDGKQLFGLAYDSNQQWLLFDYMENHFRNIATLSLKDTTFANLVATAEWDERDISPTQDGGLIYASDQSGIFNLYYIDSQTNQQGYVTNVAGGAFMPAVGKDGRILYSLYEDGGYKIALLDSAEFIADGLVGYDPDYFTKFVNLPEPLVMQDQTPERHYQDAFSPMFIFPKVMMDYGMIKPGFYFYSAEMLNKLRVFGGASINLVRDLDLFLLFELRTLYPTLFAEFYFVTRHISEESRLWHVYDYGADIRYRLVQWDSGIRVPILDANELKLFGSYQNFRASSVWWVPSASLLAKSGIDYYVGKHLGIAWTTDVSTPTVDQTINPSNGFSLRLELRKEWDEFFNADSSRLEPVFDRYRFLRMSGEGSLHLLVPRTSRWTVSLEIEGGRLSDTAVDSFFNFFAGGLPGLKGYPFYAIEGNRMAVGTFFLRIPLMREKHVPFGPLVLQNIVLGALVQAGDAWEGSHDRFSVKRSAGIQIRLGGFSFYNYPTGIGVEFHKGLDKFSSRNVDYGRDLRTYFTLLFGF